MRASSSVLEKIIYLSGRKSLRYCKVMAVFCAIFLTSASSVLAGSVYLKGEKLPHDFLASDGRNYVALDDIQARFGLSVVCQDKTLLIGGGVKGTMSISLNTHTAKVGQQEIDFETRIREDHGLLYVPDSFLEMVLGIKARPKPESSDLVLYPEVVAIIPTSNAIVISSSLNPDFTTFEYQDPPRRIIDIKNSFLHGVNLNVAGSALGTSCVAALRVSQFKIEPPIVRVVVEWEGKSAPTHTLFPDQKTLAILVGTNATNAIPSNCLNLLASGSGPDEEVTPASAVITNPADVKPAQTLTDPVISGTADTPQPKLDLPVQPAVLPPIDLLAFKGKENFTLEKLGWTVKFEEKGKDLIATINTPPFGALSDFTLPGKGNMRLVLDLTGTYIPGDERKIEGHGDIAKIRFAQFKPDVTRIVLDLSRISAHEIEKDPMAGKITLRFFAGSLAGRTIVIDPGHGGEDPGAVVSNVEEKKLNLQMALILKKYLEDHGAKVKLTRDKDVYITLADRVGSAVEGHADLFVCIHNNATDEPTTMQGSMILFKDQRWMPLYRLAYRGIAARTGVPGLGPVSDERGLYILRNCNVPVLFVEAAFMSNRIDFARLVDTSSTYAQNIMMGVRDGIVAYFEGRELPPVKHPSPDVKLKEGIFDLGGRSVVAAGASVGKDDSGSVWDTSKGKPGESVSDKEKPAKDEAKPAKDEKKSDAKGDAKDSGDSKAEGASKDKDKDKKKDDDKVEGQKSDDTDGKNKYHRRRGRGAFRFHKKS